MHEVLDNAMPMNERTAHEWARMISKLRWIGLHDEARRLEQAVNMLPPEQRASGSGGQFTTE